MRPPLAGGRARAPRRVRRATGREEGGGHGAGRDARPWKQDEAAAAARAFKVSDVPLLQGPPNSAKAATGQRRLLP